MRTSLVVACALLTSSVAHADDEAPPLSGRRIAGEIAAGAALAVPVGLLGALVGGAFCPDGAAWTCLDRAAAGAFVGAVIGVGSGVYLVGASGDQRGSLAATLGGALAGGAVSGLIMYAARDRADEDDWLPLTIGIAAPPFIGALLGFNLTRHYGPRGPAPVGALLNHDEHGLTLGVPLVVGGTLSLARGSF